MLKMELYRALWNRYCLLAMSLALLSLGYGLHEYRLGPEVNTQPFFYNAYNAWLFANLGPHATITLIAPLIVVLPFADSLGIDRSQGYLKHVLARSAYRRYLGAKMLANFVAGGLALTVPFLLLFIYTNFVYPRGLPPVGTSHFSQEHFFGPLGELYRTTPDLYILFRIAIYFLFGATYATLGLAISVFATNRYIILSTPFLLYIVADLFLNIIGWWEWGPSHAIIFGPSIRSSWLTILTAMGVVFLASLLCLLLFARKERIYLHQSKN